jgi:biotin transporter BioY
MTMIFGLWALGFFLTFPLSALLVGVDAARTGRNQIAWWFIALILSPALAWSLLWCLSQRRPAPVK